MRKRTIRTMNFPTLFRSLASSALAMYRPSPLLLAVAGLALAQSSHAILFDFSIAFYSGPLSGQSFAGQIETTAGDGDKTPSNGGLLAFDVTVNGTDYQMSDDPDFNLFPQVRVAGGGTFLDKVGYLGEKSGGQLAITLAGVSYHDALFQFSIGTFDHRLATGVPDSGATALLLFAGVSGLAMARRRS